MSGWFRWERKKTNTNTPLSYHDRTLVWLFQQGHSFALICHAGFLFFKLYVQTIRCPKNTKFYPETDPFLSLCVSLGRLIPEVIPAAVYATPRVHTGAGGTLPDSNKLTSSRLLLYMFLTNVWETDSMWAEHHAGIWSCRDKIRRIWISLWFKPFSYFGSVILNIAPNDSHSHVLSVPLLLGANCTKYILLYVSNMFVRMLHF